MTRIECEYGDSLDIERDGPRVFLTTKAAGARATVVLPDAEFLRKELGEEEEIKAFRAAQFQDGKILTQQREEISALRLIAKGISEASQEHARRAEQAKSSLDIMAAEIVRLKASVIHATENCRRAQLKQVEDKVHALKEQNLELTSKLDLAKKCLVDVRRQANDALAANAPIIEEARQWKERAKAALLEEMKKDARIVVLKDALRTARSQVKPSEKDLEQDALGHNELIALLVTAPLNGRRPSTPKETLKNLLEDESTARATARRSAARVNELERRIRTAEETLRGSVPWV